MTVRIAIIGQSLEFIGHVQVNPFDYEYTGDDDKVRKYLEELNQADDPFPSPIDIPPIPDDPSPSEKNKVDLLYGRMTSFDSIFDVLLPDEYEDV